MKPKITISLLMFLMLGGIKNVNAQCRNSYYGANSMNAVITHEPISCNDGLYTITLNGMQDGPISYTESLIDGTSISQNFVDSTYTTPIDINVHPGSTVQFTFGISFYYCGSDQYYLRMIDSYRQQVVVVPIPSLGLNTYYADADGDGFGNPLVTVKGCILPVGYVTDSTDGDDNNKIVRGPLITNCSNDIAVRASTGSCGAPVSFNTPLAYDIGPAGLGDTTFNYTAYFQPWIVPDNVYSIFVDAVGCYGERAAFGGYGGKPGRVQTRLSVTPGETFYICPGNPYSFPTGGVGTTVVYPVGDGNNFYFTAGNGGSLTQLGRTGTQFGDTLIVAGGGGGATEALATLDGYLSGYDGGDGGDVSIANPGDIDFMQGMAGTRARGVPPGPDYGDAASGGGGGGFKGGSTLSYLGGAGGSSHVATVGTSNTVFTKGYTGNYDYLRITYTKQYNMVQTAGQPSGSQFPVGITPVAFKYSSSNGVTLSCSFNVTVSGTLQTWYLDADNDGHYISSLSAYCNPGAGYNQTATVFGDCNDNDNTKWQTATLYIDKDDDNYDNGTATVCYGATIPPGYKVVTLGFDCDDTNATVYPGAPEICDGLDNNCNGVIDEGVTQTWYLDADGDGYGNAAISITACSKPVGYVSNNTDCNDGNAGIHPGAIEICDGIDNNCNGLIDEGVKITYYRDADGDGYGNPLLTIQACSLPSGYVTNNTDCNDGNAAIHPGAKEICDGIDNNCNGLIDENCYECKNATGLTISNITAGSATLSWIASVNPAEWQVQYKSTMSTSIWKNVKSISGESARSVTVSGLTAGVTYKWHIAAKCGKTWTPFADGPSFTTFKAGERYYKQENEIEVKLPGFKIYPNPTNGEFKVDLYLTDKINATVKLELLDNTGRTVYRQNATMRNGMLQQTFMVSSFLTPGVYTAKIIANNKSYQTKLVYKK